MFFVRLFVDSQSQLSYPIEPMVFLSNIHYILHYVTYIEGTIDVSQEPWAIRKYKAADVIRYCVISEQWEIRDVHTNHEGGAQEVRLSLEFEELCRESS